MQQLMREHSSSGSSQETLSKLEMSSRKDLKGALGRVPLKFPMFNAIMRPLSQNDLIHNFTEYMPVYVSIEWCGWLKLQQNTKKYVKSSRYTVRLKNILKY